ncbi:hypothetical protein A2U01_0057580, partial [Trifolium medium]|nr:hypothetical protein [Trifolium medium]
KEGGKLRFPQTAPLILHVDQSRLMARTVVEQSTGGGVVPADTPMPKSIQRAEIQVLELG